MDLNSDSFSGSSKFGEPENSAILAPKSSNQENCEKTPILETKAAVSFLMPQGVLCYQTTLVWFVIVKNEYFMAKIDVHRSLLPSERVIAWDMKMTWHIQIQMQVL